MLRGRWPSGLRVDPGRPLEQLGVINRREVWKHAAWAEAQRAGYGLVKWVEVGRTQGEREVSGLNNEVGGALTVREDGRQWAGA